MKGILRYIVIKEKEIEFNDITFATNENIKMFWDELLAKEENGIKIVGKWIKDPITKKKIYK